MTSTFQRSAETGTVGNKDRNQEPQFSSGVRRALSSEIVIRRERVAAGTLEQDASLGRSRGETQLMSCKESAHDYRYFPDPDLLPVKTASIVWQRPQKPELPWEKRARYVADFGVTEYDAAVLAADLPTAAL